MYYEFKKLEKLVLQASGNAQEFDPEHLQALLDEIQCEHQRLKTVLLESVNKLGQSDKIRTFIESHQRGLIELLNGLWYIINKTNELITGKKLFIHTLQKTVFLLLEDLLHFIENRYRNFCDVHVSVNNKHKFLRIKNFSKQISILFPTMDNLPELFHISLYPIVQLIENPQQKISYERIVYLAELLKELSKIIVSSEEKELKILKSLVSLNFNSFSFFQYCVKRFRNELDKLDSFVEKTDFLAFHLKFLNQIPVRPGYSLFSGRKSISEYISNWILEEICYLERKMTNDFNPKHEQELQDQNKKILTSLTVSQMACFVRIFVEVGAIKGMVKEDVIRFYATHYSSKYQENISHGSFRSKYFVIEDSVKRDVKDLILRMLDELKKLKTE